MEKKCAICHNPEYHCIPYKTSFICEECLDYICSLEPLKSVCQDTKEAQVSDAVSVTARQ